MPAIAEEILSLPRSNFDRLVPVLFLLVANALGMGGCALVATRPTQELNNANAAIRAAKEVQADVLSPELFRLASEWALQARKEYRFRNFKESREYSIKARLYAEQAEFEALKNGGNRASIAPPDPMAQPDPMATASPPPSDPGAG